MKQARKVKPESGLEERQKNDSNTRTRLLESAEDLFGRVGFEKASTRAIADAANANIQAIPYYFGGKEGLYAAVAENLSERVRELTKDLREVVAEQLALGKRRKSGRLGHAAAVKLLGEMTRELIYLFLNPKSEPTIRFIIKEQMEPTAAFARIHERVIDPIFGLCNELIAILLDEPDPSTRYVRIRTIAYVGSILIFRLGHATLVAQTGIDSLESLDARSRDEIDKVAADLARSIRKSGSKP